MKNTTILLLIFSAMLLSCGNKKNSQNEVQQQEPVVVKVATAISKEFNGERQYPGTFKPFREANLGTSLPGKVEKIFFPEGAYVKQGELIVQLSAELTIQAEIEYNTLKKDYERVCNLMEKNSISQQEFDHVKAKYDATKAKYEMLKKNTEVRAPFDGIVVEHMVHEGENYFLALSMDPGYSLTSGIIRFMQLSPLLFEVEAGELELSKMQIGSDARVFSYAYPDIELQGKVYKISPTLSTVSKTATVSISVPNPGGKIKPGMGGTAGVKLPAQQAVFVPQAAISSEFGSEENYVFVVRSNMVSKQVVKVIGYDGDLVAVEGLEADTQVAITGKNKLSDKMQVIISK